jgi:hypothetical protein
MKSTLDKQRKNSKKNPANISIGERYAGDDRG